MGGPYWPLSPVLLPCFLLGLTPFAVLGGHLVSSRRTAHYQALACGLVTLLCAAFLHDKYRSELDMLEMAVMWVYQALGTMACLFWRRAALRRVVTLNLDYCANVTQVSSTSPSPLRLQQLQSNRPLHALRQRGIELFHR